LPRSRSVLGPEAWGTHWPGSGPSTVREQEYDENVPVKFVEVSFMFAHFGDLGFSEGSGYCGYNSFKMG